MFANNMKETNTDRVDIEDLDPDVVCDMLLFIYTGGTPNIGKNAGDLIAAADKYQLEQLKGLCEER